MNDNNETAKSEEAIKDEKLPPHVPIPGNTAVPAVATAPKQPVPAATVPPVTTVPKPAVRSVPESLKPPPSASKPAPGMIASTKKDGNDRVSADNPPQQPLNVIQTLEPPTKTPTAVVGPTSAALGSQPMSGFATSPVSMGFQSNPIPKPAVNESAIEAAREPLTKLYGPYLNKTTDRSLKDARDRLRKAITQTRALRQSFTDRVYGKYRVCLRPPPSLEEILRNAQTDPKGTILRINAEMDKLRIEKEEEKREAVKLNNEMAQSRVGERPAALANVDNADQLMFFTAGLNLVILPEDKVDASLVAGYAERSPSDNGKSKSISLAAATAGEVVLDRTRKAAAMRLERQRRKKLQTEGEASNYSRLQIISDADAKMPGPVVPKAVTTTAAQKSSSFRRASAAAAPKITRPRGAYSISASALLTMHPSADEIKVEGKRQRASTAALVSRGVASAKSIQQRLKHPHPESLGGRRRANLTPQNQSDAFAQANLANSLPPLPAAQERLERKPIEAPMPTDAGVQKAFNSCRTMLRHFTDDAGSLVSQPKISLLTSLRKMKAAGAQSTSSELSLAISVLHAVGIVRNDTASNREMFKLAPYTPSNTALNTAKFRHLYDAVKADTRTLSRRILHEPFESKKRPLEKPEAQRVPKVAKMEAQATTAPSVPESKTPVVADASKAVAVTDAIPAEKIRGGGDGVANEPGGGSDPGEREAAALTAAETSKKRPRSETAPETEQTEAAQANGPPDPYRNPAAMSAYHLANQLRHLQRPGTGDLADYLGNMHQSPQTFSSIMSGQAQPSLATMGFGQTGMMGYSLQDRAAAARAMLVREQQAALGFGPPGGATGYPHMGHHNTMSAYMGTTTAPPQQHASKKRKSSPPEETLKKPSDPGPSESAKKPAPAEPPNSAPQAPIATKGSLAGINKKLQAPKPAANPTPAKPDAKKKSGLTMFFPDVPPSLVGPIATHIRSGQFFKAVKGLGAAECGVAVKYLQEVGAAVPIPKGLVSNPLKEKLGAGNFRMVGTTAVPPITREVVASAILVWLWGTYEAAFQTVFEKTGRIDVDANCKSLIQASVDSAVGELSFEIAQSIARGRGAFAEAAAARRSMPQQNVMSGGTLSQPLGPDILKRLDISTAFIVSKALNTKLSIVQSTDAVIPKYQKCLDLLEEARVGALRARAQERTLLANLMARNTQISENFGAAYMSSVAKAGEALGHDKLFEIVQDSSTGSSTMIPYDMFADDDSFWEDSCKPPHSFTPNLTGDDLMRRAHARAVFEKALRKLQDKHQIHGGISSYGPYIDQGYDVEAKAATFNERAHAQVASPRAGTRRRVSSVVEPTLVPGTGSSAAWSWNVYDPKHFCSPLEYDKRDISNSPYGSQMSGLLKKATGAYNKGLSTRSSALQRSTVEIDWSSVAGDFHHVAVERRTTRKSQQKDSHDVPTNGGPIVAPICRRVGVGDDSCESDTEEDVSDAAVLAAHQIVLDEMKTKLDAFLEARKKHQDRRKNRQSKS